MVMQSLDSGWQGVVNDWLKKNRRSRAWLCRQAQLSETHMSHQMYGRRGIKDETLRDLEKVMGLAPETLVELKREMDETGGRTA